MHFWNLIDSSGVGGAERHIATLATSFVTAGHSVTVILYDGHGQNPWFEQLDEAGIPFRVLDGKFSTLLRVLRQERPDVLHTHGYKGGILGRLAATLSHIPVVSTFHSGERGPFPVGLYDWVDDWTSILSHRIAVSPAIQARLPFSSHVIPSYVRTLNVAPASPLPRHIGFVGRLSAEKCPDLFCSLARRHPDVAQWHMYGDGPMRGALEAEYSGCVTFHGVQTQMDRVWPTLGLLVMPSLFEGVPLAALESLAAGVPVMASRVGGLPTVIDHGRTGWLFPQGDLDAASGFITQWSKIVNEGDGDLRHSCWQNARDRFSEARWFPEVIEVYAQAVGRSVVGAA